MTVRAGETICPVCGTAIISQEQPVLPQAPPPNAPHGVPQTAPYQNRPQGVPQAVPPANYPQGVPQTAPYQGFRQGYPPPYIPQPQGQQPVNRIPKEDYYDFIAPPEIRKFGRNAWILYLIFSTLSVIALIVRIVFYVMLLTPFGEQPDYNDYYSSSYYGSGDYLFFGLIIIYTLISRIAIYILGFLGVRKKRMPLCIAYLIVSCVQLSILDIPGAICALVNIRKFNYAYEQFCAGYVPPYPAY